MTESSAETAVPQWVEIAFDCIPLRTMGRLEVPMDASPKYRARCERIRAAMEKHGTFNTYYLVNASCKYHLANHPTLGMLEFKFEGTVFTSSDDLRTDRADLTVELVRETCDWLTKPIVDWFHESVQHAVRHEFDRYISAGDLEKAKKRIAELQAKADEHGGYVGMYL